MSLKGKRKKPEGTKEYLVSCSFGFNIWSPIASHSFILAHLLNYFKHHGQKLPLTAKSYESLNCI